MSDLEQAQQRARTRRRAAQMRQAKRTRYAMVTISVPMAGFFAALAGVRESFAGLNAAIAKALSGITME